MVNLPQVASALQASGTTVLLYDPRSTGQSGGHPRNDIDPPQCVGDMADALTHLVTLPHVDPGRAGVLGFSFGGTVALTAACVDPRCAFVVAAAPLTDLDFVSPAQRARVMARCAQDRASQVLGNEPLSVPMVDERGRNSVGFGHGYDAEHYAALARKGRGGFAPGHVNRTTLMTYFKMAMWVPWPLWKTLGSGAGEEEKKKKMKKRSGLRGVMFVVPENDTMSYAELQRRHFDELPSHGSFRKEKIEVAGAGHEDVFSEEHLGTVAPGIAGFIKSLFSDAE